MPSQRDNKGCFVCFWVLRTESGVRVHRWVKNGFVLLRMMKVDIKQEANHVMADIAEVSQPAM